MAGFAEALPDGAHADGSYANPTGYQSSHRRSAVPRPGTSAINYACPSTSFVHTLSIARSLLEAEGVVQPETQRVEQAPEVVRRYAGGYFRTSEFAYSAGPILDLGFEKVSSAFSEFVQTIYPLYPCIDIAAVSSHLTAIFLHSADQMADPETDSLTIMDIDILKAVVGVSLLVNGRESSPLAIHLPRYLDWSLQKFLMGSGPQAQDIVLTVLLVPLPIFCEHWPFH